MTLVEINRKEIAFAGLIRANMASGGGLVSDQNRQLVIVLYRALLSSARRFDKNPAWKALIASKPREQYDFLRQRWLPSHTKQPEDSIERLKQSFLYSVVEDLLQGGTFYKPFCSWQNTLKEAFRLRFREYSAFVYSDKLQSSLVDLGFKGLRILQHFENMAHSELGLAGGSFPLKQGEYPSLNLDLIDEIQKGALLVSHPLLPGAFARSLILIHEYYPQTGAKGFCLNGSKVGVFEPSVLLSSGVSKLRGELNVELADNTLGRKDDENEQVYPLSPQPVYWGGPVATNTLFVLHPFPEMEGAVAVGHGIYMGGRSSAIIDSIRKGKAHFEDFLLLAGCSSWSSDQLEGELKQHSWFLTNGNDIDKLFHFSSPTVHFPEQLPRKDPSDTTKKEEDIKWLQNYRWKSILWNLGGEYAHFTNIPCWKGNHAMEFVEDCG
ncbi:putative transcriptional regulator [Galdieria sulphuraria]|uniref:Putative transcriptional regulator n=1 Tax=Galdieria sulphuraria TaxID=130081 RepID=M2Y947_GALSU|nr:putative transcriptional regulator [Galdieria sulphuraria]EME32359.1 putative transcriptional regulator [Galdieria sulphuraria]|eukprot:XP_005708879.1 putative transcriptional regulator [Galdieria sulphuraria]